MPPAFTHTFEFKLDNVQLSGEAEFNADDEASYLPDQPHHLTTSQCDRINALFEECTKIFHKFGNIDKIEIASK